MDDNILAYIEKENAFESSPLAYKLRAKTLDEIVGQKDIIGKDKLLYKMIKTDSITSIIFYGPPGCGKTTIARVIANTTKANFTQINATNASKSDMVDIVEFAKKERK
ncbi:MAG: AAA family ATPase, partial [Lachnospiraceae bacterium]|nr:AAA family ATPase [Lachnospiraceae bacterium]